MELLHFVPADDAARRDNPTELLTLMLQRGQSASEQVKKCAERGWKPLKELPKKERREYRQIVEHRNVAAAREMARIKASRK